MVSVNRGDCMEIDEFLLEETSSKFTFGKIKGKFYVVDVRVLKRILEFFERVKMEKIGITINKNLIMIGGKNYGIILPSLTED